MSVTIESFLSKSKKIRTSESVYLDGKVSQVVGLVIEATGPQNAVGSLCNIHSQNGVVVRAEIVGFKENKILLMPLDETINDHYADILWKLNKKIQARYFWSYVLNLENIDTALKEKINKKLLFGIE